jgi:hemoglobin-like flavoprotein
MRCRDRYTGTGARGRPLRVVEERQVLVTQRSSHARHSHQAAAPPERPDRVESPVPSLVPRPAPEVIAAVCASCRAVADRPVRLAEAFYEHLFEIAPQLRAMFADDLTEQMQRMSDTLLGAIARLEIFDTAQLEAALRRLGADHRTRHGVEAEQYRYVGHALTRAVRDVAGLGYSGALSSSWIAVYQYIAGHMTAGAREAESVMLPRPRESRDRDV